MVNWVSVKESNPPLDYGLYLLRVDREGEIPTYDIGFYDDRGWHSRLDQKYRLTVTHWMPLPEPPKEDNNKCPSVV
jgi:hypothetical protein